MKVSTRSAVGPLIAFALLPAVWSCDVPTAPPRIQSVWRFPTESLEVPVTGLSVTTIMTQDLGDIDLVDHIESAVVHVTPRNPFNASGTILFVMTGGGVTVQASIDVRSPGQLIPLTRAEVRALLGGLVTFRATATLCRASGCVLAAPPFDIVTLDTEIEVVVEIGGEG